MGFVQLGGDCSALILKGMAVEEISLVPFWWIDWFGATELTMIGHDCFVPACKLLAMEGSTSLLQSSKVEMLGGKLTVVLLSLALKVTCGISVRNNRQAVLFTPDITTDGASVREWSLVTTWLQFMAASRGEGEKNME